MVASSHVALCDVGLSKRPMKYCGKTRGIVGHVLISLLSMPMENVSRPSLMRRTALSEERMQPVV